MSGSPRLRFAPSPTGMFHVGGARTALFNWLYVRRHQGTLVLRIEDTDESRNREEWTGGIMDAMSWLGLDWDEGPNHQSANRSKHVEAGQKLYADGKAYYCDCTREIVDERTKENATPGYDRFCRDRGLGPGVGHALRFRIPEGRTVVNDLVRGDVEFDNSTIEDFVVVRSTGVPMYVLANMVDDLEDRITHVVRGEEHLPNTPKQIMLWTALGGPELPAYAHLPVIVNEARKKLSKRRDKVSLEMYRDEGYLPEAMRNYLALLGWSPKGDREIVPLSVLVDEFDFADVQKSSAFFDVKKLDAFNGEYIRALSIDEFITQATPFLDNAGGRSWPKENFSPATFREMAPLVQERVARLDEVAPMVEFFFVDSVSVAPELVPTDERQLSILSSAAERYSVCDWTAEALHAETLALGEAVGLKLGKAQAPIRLAVTGRKVGPPLFESLVLLGRNVVLARIAQLRQMASAAN